MLNLLNKILTYRPKWYERAIRDVVENAYTSECEHEWIAGEVGNIIKLLPCTKCGLEK